MDSTIHINKYGVAYASNSGGTITNILIKDENSNSISTSYDSDNGILKFRVNKFVEGDTDWTTDFFNEALTTTTAYNTDNLQEGWYQVSIDDGVTWQNVYLCKYDRFAGNEVASSILTDNSDSISISNSTPGILTFHKVSNVEESFSTVIAYSESNAQIELSTSTTYSPDCAYIFEKVDATYSLYQALPFYPDENGNYTFEGTEYKTDEGTEYKTDPVRGYFDGIRYWRKEQPIAYFTPEQPTENDGQQEPPESGESVVLAGIDFSGVTANKLFIPAQRPSVGEKEFCIFFNDAATSISISNSLLAAYGQTSYLHGTFDVSYHILDGASSRLNYGNGKIIYRSYIEDFTLQSKDYECYCKSKEDFFDFAFKVKSGNIDISEEYCDDLRFWITNNTDNSNSASYSGSYPSTYKPDAQYGIHQYTKAKDDYIHALLPWGQMGEQRYPAIEISNSSNAAINGYYYYKDNTANPFEILKAKYQAHSNSLVLPHTSGLYRIKARIDEDEDYSYYVYYLDIIDNNNNRLYSTQCYSRTQGEDESEWPEDPEFSNSQSFIFEPNNVKGILRSSVKITTDNANKVLFMKVEDTKGNKSNYVETKVNIKNTPPSSTFLQLIGSTGKNEYTGLYEKYSRFFPYSFVTVEYAASDMKNMAVELIVGNELIFEYKTIQPKNLYTSQVLLPYSNNSTIEQTFVMTFTDIAGNSIAVNKTILCNNKLYRLSETNLVENSEQLTANGMVMVQTQISDENTYYRAWNEYWFPRTHQLPTLDDGSINTVQALRQATETRTDEQVENFDVAYYIENKGKKTLQVDTEGRVQQVWDDTKIYENGVNDFQSLTDGLDNLQYYIINSHDTSDFRLEFEYFDLSDEISQSGKNKIAYNLGYKGDVLVVYDASADGCTTKHNNNGIVSYTLKNPALLKRLFAIRGSHYKNKDTITIKDLTDSELSNSWEKPVNGVITPAINSNLICLIPYTDRSATASGFKLKAGPKLQYEYENYDINYTTGEVWVHHHDIEYKDLAFTATYKYYENSVDIDYEKGAVILTNTINDYPLIGNIHVYMYLSSKGNGVPFSYLTGEQITTFLTSQDDFQDYTTPMFYCSPNEYYLSSTVKQNTYNEVQTVPYGRLSKFYVNKDEGYIDFKNYISTDYSIPKGRIFGSYYYHTLYRLTSDGYGDLSFYDNILVPALDASGYKDWTYVDLMIVNEGTAHLQSGTMKLLARGYVSSGTTVDTVLDNNRPWDQQEGSLEQTVNRCRGEFNPSYLALKRKLPATRGNAMGDKNATISLETINTKSNGYIRLFWTLAASDNSWVQCTRGNKLFSAELAGTYNSFGVN